jgi:hypothetical protein
VIVAISIETGTVDQTLNRTFTFPEKPKSSGEAEEMSY